MNEDWKYRQLSEVASIKSGYTPSSYDLFDEGDYPYFKVGDMNAEGNEVYLHYSDSYLKAPCKTFPQGAIVFPKNGAAIGTNKKRILKQASVVDLNTAILIPNDDIRTEFLYYWLQRIDFREITRRGAVPTLDIQELKLSLVPLLSIAEQERIVAELDLLSGIIDKQKAQLKELDILAQSIFYDMFGSVDDNKEGFEVETLNQVFSLITDGTHQTPEYTEDREKGFKFLSAKDVVSGKIDWTNIKYIPESLHIELHKRLAPQRGDILLCKNGTTGICALVETDEVFDIYVSLALLRTSRTLSKKYLVAAINNPSTKRQFDESLKGIGVPNLHLGEIKKTRIIVPPLDLQESFEKKISIIEKEKESINQSIAESQKLFDYTMDKYFS